MGERKEEKDSRSLVLSRMEVAKEPKNWPATKRIGDASGFSAPYE